MSAIVSTHQNPNSTLVQQPNTSLQTTTLNLRKAMKRLFKSSNNTATNANTTTTTLTPNATTKITISPTSDDTKTRSRLSYAADDCGSSRRGKSMDGRPSLDPSPANGIAIASSSVIHLGLPSATSEELPPSPSKPQAPPSSFRAKFRPKSLQTLRRRLSSDNGGGTRQQRPLVRNPSSELSSPPPMPQVAATTTTTKGDESSKSVGGTNPSSSLSSGLASARGPLKSLADEKTTTSASDETRSHATSSALPITSPPPLPASSSNASSSKETAPEPSQNHMASSPNDERPRGTASLTEGQLTAEPVEQMRQEEDQKQKQKHDRDQDVLRNEEQQVVDAPPSRLTSPSASAVPPPPPISTSTSDSVASVPHKRRPGSEDFSRPRAFTTDDAMIATANASIAGSGTPPPSSAVSGLKLRVDHPRLASLPLPSTSSLAQEFSALNSPASPNHDDTATSPTSAHPLVTPHPPGAFHHPHQRSMTLPSAPMSPLSPRRLQNASTPGTYVMPDGAVTMKMTPSLVMSRPMMGMGATSSNTNAPRPRFGSLLVSGVSMGERESGMERARTEQEPRNSPARPMRGALPALRRDGSSFYMNLTRSGSASGARTPAAAAAAVPLPAEEEDEGEEDDDDDIMDEDSAMADEAASDDEGSEETHTRPVTTPLLGGMAKAVRAMGLPFGSGSAGSTPSASTPKANASPLLSSTASYFRPRHTLDHDEGPTTPTPRRTASSSSTAALQRRSLVADGAPSMGLGTVDDDEDQHATPLQTPKPSNQEFLMPIPRPSKPTSPPAQASHTSSPRSHRTSEYHTPLPTPTPSAFSDSTARETVYFDAESGGSDAENSELIKQARAVALPDESGAGSAFTTFSMGSTSTLTAVDQNEGSKPMRPVVQSNPSAVTVKPEQTRPALPHSEGSGSSGGSALGLDVPAPVEEGSVRAARSGSTSSQQRGRQEGRSKDYFSSRPNNNTNEPPSTPSQVDVLRTLLHAKHTLSPRTPGGRPMMYTHQVSHSMLDFGSMRMSGSGMRDDEGEVQPPLPSVKGKGKEREGTVMHRSPSRTPKHAIRRRSLPDMSGLRAPPPPYPKISIREEEGKEALPPYSCRIHFEASVMRKMEFDHPGMLAKDRSWRRVYVVLNGTTLRVFKQNPRMYPVKPVPLKVGVRKSIKDYAPGGKNGDGIVGLEDVTIGAPHVHLPEEVLPKVESGGGPLKKVPSRGSGGSAGQSSSAARRSLDGASRTSGRRSFDLPNRRTTAGTSRSSMSSSSNLTSESSSTTLTSPISDSMADLLADDTEKGRPVPAPPGPSAVLGASRPSNSQSASRSTGSQILASIQTNTVLRQYSLAGAETGLASDYHKRKNVIRVRAEGEQFLIQADNVFMAIDWIETFQAGANVALDLDERPMPKVPAFPRRRRRRRAPTTTEGGAAAPEGNDNSRPERPNGPPREPSTVVVTAPTPSHSTRSGFFGRRRETPT